MRLHIYTFELLAIKQVRCSQVYPLLSTATFPALCPSYQEPIEARQRAKLSKSLICLPNEPAFSDLTLKAVINTHWC